VGIVYEWRGEFSNPELNALHAETFEHPLGEHDWRDQVERHSLGWACARDASGLVGWVYAAWDGGSHAFLLDPIVSKRAQRRGIGRRLVGLCVEHARAAGYEWLHVDFDDDLRPFYFDACGFTPTNAGLIRLDEEAPPSHLPTTAGG